MPCLTIVARRARRRKWNRRALRRVEPYAACNCRPQTAAMNRAAAARWIMKLLHQVFRNEAI